MAFKFICNFALPTVCARLCFVVSLLPVAVVALALWFEMIHVVDGGVHVQNCVWHGCLVL